MSEGLMKMAEGYEMIAVGIRQMVSEGRGVPEAAEKTPDKKETSRIEECSAGGPKDRPGVPDGEVEGGQDLRG